MNTPIIPRRYHWITDYSYIPAVAAAPDLFRFGHVRKAAQMCRLFSGGVLAASLFTRAEWGVFKTMPYKAHVALDFGTGIAALAMPWLLGFAKNNRARNTFLVMGAVGITASLLSGLFTGKTEELPAAAVDATASGEADGLTPPVLAPLTA